MRLHKAQERRTQVRRWFRPNRHTCVCRSLSVIPLRFAPGLHLIRNLSIATPLTLCYNAPQIIPLSIIRSMNTQVLYSVFKRNFVGYLSNPTGYVFICVFVLLSSIAAFLPDDFFNANLANLDQLNRWFPLVMLAFIPAIAMGIWVGTILDAKEELP